MEIKDEHLICSNPECDSEFMHPVYVQVKHAGKKGQSVSVDSGGVWMHQGISMKDRGTKINMVFWCEWCHEHTEVEFLFHKGSTLVMDRITPDTYSSDTVWRD